MVLDIHAHTALTGLFVYGNSYDDVYRYERHIVFPKILAQNCEDFNSTNTIYNADCKKSGSVRRHMTSYLSHEVNTYTVEVSLLGFEDKEKRQIIPYTDELYARVGGTCPGPCGITTRLSEPFLWKIPPTRSRAFRNPL